MQSLKSAYRLSTPDLELILTMVRAGSLPVAAQRLGVDTSTVFRNLQRLERSLGEPLFERSRSGYTPKDVANFLAVQAEMIESILEQTRSDLHNTPQDVSGTVRITTTDTILHGLIAPQLQALRTQHPLLEFDLQTGNELANLTKRDSDIAVRATKRPPAHLIGKCIGPIRVALYGSKAYGPRRFDEVKVSQWDWIAPDDALPEHPSVVWRRKYYPRLAPRIRASSILSVAELIAQGLGVGLLPLFLAEQRSDLRRLTEAIDECTTDLWLLTHTDSRHLRRVSTVYSHLAQHLVLE